MGASRVWWTINCKKHGMADYRKGIDPNIIRRVKVQPPKNKRIRFNGGCPHCVTEQRKEQ